MVDEPTTRRQHAPAPRPSLNQTRVVGALCQLAEAVRAAGDPRDTLHLIASRVRDLLGADRSAIFAWDDTARTLVAASAVPEEPAVRPIAAGSGVVAAAFEQRRPIVLDDYLAASYRHPAAIAWGVRAVAVVPLILGGRGVGVLGVYRRRPQPYTPAQADALWLLGTLVVAPLLELARLQRRFAEQQADVRTRAGRLLELEPLPPSARLTRRERDILPLLATGRTNREIGAALHLSPGTVRNVVGRLLTKLGARDRTHVVVLAIARGLLGDEQVQPFG